MNHHHQTFILEMIKHGDKQRAYQKAYPKCKGGESARKAAERLLRNLEIAAEIDEATAAIRDEAYKEAYRMHRETEKVKILSIMKKREILTQIATCEMKVGRYVKEDDRYFMVYQDPRPADIIKAIELDTKLEEACNRARNFKDPQLSQFDIYIDGRPCDDPNAPINPEIPKGLVMLPRRKKQNTENGNKKEQFTLSPAGGGVHTADGGGTPAQEKNSHSENGNKSEQKSLSPAGGGVRTADGGGTPAQDSYTTAKNQRLSCDPLSESLYKNFVRDRNDAPPPHILTDEELKAINDEAAKQEKPSYNTTGKMYFPEKSIKPGNIMEQKG